MANRILNKGEAALHGKQLKGSQTATNRTNIPSVSQRTAGQCSNSAIQPTSHQLCTCHAVDNNNNYKCLPVTLLSIDINAAQNCRSLLVRCCHMQQWLNYRVLLLQLPVFFAAVFAALLQLSISPHGGCAFSA